MNSRTAPRLAIIIPCLGHAAELDKCLMSLERQAGLHSCEVLVVDSAWDARVAAVAERYGFVRLIRSPAHLSPGQARNLGAQSASAEWLAFLDADCVTDDSPWVIQALESTGTGNYLCGGPVLDLFPNHPIAWADNRLQFADFQRGRRAGAARYFPGCNLLIARRVFFDLGGFSAEFLVGEDTALCALAHSRYPDKMHFEPRLAVRHHGRKTWRALLAHQRILGHRRSYSRLHLDASYHILMRHPVLAGLVILRRLGYITLRTIQYDRPGLLRLAIFFPWVIAGLAAWTAGFYSGYMKDESEP